MCGAGSCIAADAAAANKAATVSPAKAKTKTVKSGPSLADMAPADEYFGPLKLSIIGISNTIRDVGLRYTYNHDIGAQSLASAQLTESAVRDWLRRYPRDPQLPRNVFYLQRLYTKILLQPSRDRAAIVAKLLFADFPSSPQARQLKKTLAVEHLEPLQSTATPDAETTVAPPSVIPSGAIVPTPLASGSIASPTPVAPRFPVATSTPLPASPLPISTPTSPSLPHPAPTYSVGPIPTPAASPVPSTSATPH